MTARALENSFKRHLFTTTTKNTHSTTINISNDEQTDDEKSAFN